MSRTHTLKTWPEPFSAVLDRRKRYEIRFDDRGFAVDDILRLREWDPSPDETGIARGFTGRECYRRVSYMTPGGAWGLPPRLCVLSLDAEGFEK